MTLQENGSADIDVDKLLAEVEAPSPGREAPTEGAESSPGETSEAPAAQTNPWWSGVEFEWNGKKIRPDSEDKARTWISQGYNYSQRMGELNTKLRGLTEQEKAIEAERQKFSRYAEIDAYVQKDPNWWRHVEESWQSRQKPQVPSELEPVLSPILNKLQETESVLEAWKESQRQAEIQKQDQALEAEIESTRKEFPKYDFASVDASGKTLETRILNHANKIGTGSFRVAARDYLWERLQDEAKAQGRMAVAKAEQTAAQKGILGTTKTPVKGLAPAQNVRGKSYDQLMAEALSELGAGNK